MVFEGPEQIKVKWSCYVQLLLGQYLLLIFNSHPSPSRVPDTSTLLSGAKCEEMFTAEISPAYSPAGAISAI